MWSLRKGTGTGSSQPSDPGIRVRVDEDADAATIILSDAPVARTERVEGIGLVDLDEADNIIRIEIFRASEALERLRKMERQGQPRSLDAELTDAASRLVDQARERVREHGVEA